MLLEAEYSYPYAFGNGDLFTFGVEIEIDTDFAADITDSDLIAGWDNDPSLGTGGVELQTNILDMSKLPPPTRACRTHPRLRRERGRPHPRSTHSQPVRKPLVLGAARTRRNAV